MAFSRNNKVDPMKIYGAITSLLDDDKLSDVTLQSNDDIQIKAHRLLLATRSPVLKRMLFGGFAESSSQVVELGFSGEVLQALKEYIYTDETKLLSADEGTIDTDKMKKVLSLASAASYFDLPDLVKEVRDFCTWMLQQKDLKTSVIFLDHCARLGNALESSELSEPALENIRPNPKELLSNPSTLSSLSPATMEMIISDQKLEAQELTVFKIVEMWTNSSEDSNGQEVTGTDIDRKAEAAKLMTHIKFDRINPKELATTVSSSGLVPEKLLYEAYKKQALTYFGIQTVMVDYSAPRYQGCRWKQTGNHLFEPKQEGWHTDTLDCQPLKCGIYEWTIKVEAKVLGVRLFLFAVVSSHSNALRTWTYYCFSGTGRGNSAPTRFGMPKFGAGDEVRFVLDLNSTRGTLKASKNGNDEFVVLDSIKENLLESVDGQELGIVPGAKLLGAGKLRLLNFRKIA